MEKLVSVSKLEILLSLDEPEDFVANPVFWRSGGNIEFNVHFSAKVWFPTVATDFFSPFLEALRIPLIAPASLAFWNLKKQN